MAELLLDPNIRLWVFLPIVIITFLVGIVRHYVSIILSSQKKIELLQVQDSQVMIRARLLRENGKYLPRQSFAMRRHWFNNEETGYFKVQKRAAASQNPMTDPGMMTDMLKGNVTNVLPMIVIGGWINWMFSGFLTTKVPFPLTLRFKPMLQRGVELAYLDASWVSSASWYFLNVFGLRTIYALVLGENNEKRENEIHEINITLKEIQQSNMNIETSITFLTAQNEELKTKIQQLEKQTKEDKQYISVLENKLEDMQMGCRKTNFVIKNVPKKSNESKEDLIDMLMCLSNNIDCKIVKYDIKDIYRVHGQNKDNPNTPIVVETGSTLQKTEILKMGKAFNLKHKSKLCCKHLGFKTQEDTPIFITEHLTPKASRLHFLARDLTKSGNYKFCWTAYGKVYIKKDEQSPTIIIRTEDQVTQPIERIDWT